jgi:UDPglucose--hexose-1-phosphate uridylyltransferase
MAELRWNPLLRTYTMVASNRQARPHLPKDWCPFCIGSPKIPASYDVLVYPNDFPTLSPSPAVPDLESSDLYQVQENYGQCEVILYSSDHTATLPDLSLSHLVKLINTWAERTTAMAKDPKIQYVFVFENKGEEVGVTMPHPHGQIYGYSFVPLKIQVELQSCKEYYQRTGRNLLLDMNEEEKSFQKRVLFENESFISYLPFFTDYPYGAFIVSKELRATFADFSEREREDLAQMLKTITSGMDALFDKSFPYMMCVHQCPVNSEEYADSAQYYNFHIEFYPPLRDAQRIKYYASSEMGAWAAANTRAVEETAEELRNAIQKCR